MIKNASYPNLYLNNNGNMCLLYSSFNTEPDILWKLYVKNLSNNTITRINTPLNHPEHGQVISETQPHYRIDNQYKINLCYVATFKNSSGLIKDALVYIMATDLSFNTTDNININIVKLTNIGCLENNKMIYYTMYPENLENFLTTPPLIPKNQLVFDSSGFKHNIQFTDFDIVEILSIKVIHGHRQYIIVTKDSNNQIKSYVTDFNFKIISEVLNNNNFSISHCSMLNNTLYYSTFDNNNSPVLIEEQVWL